MVHKDPKKRINIDDVDEEIQKINIDHFSLKNSKSFKNKLNN